MSLGAGVAGWLATLASVGDGIPKVLLRTEGEALPIEQVIANRTHAAHIHRGTTHTLIPTTNALPLRLSGGGIAAILTLFGAGVALEVEQIRTPTHALVLLYP